MGFNEQAKHGLRVKTRLKAFFVLECSFEQNVLREILRGEKGEKVGQGDFFPFLASKVIKHLG